MLKSGLTGKLTMGDVVFCLVTSVKIFELSIIVDICWLFGTISYFNNRGVEFQNA